MALDFGKVAFSVSFNPTSAFPLDARSYFESLVDAEAAAASAKSAGSAESVYYYGQTLVVVENELASFYIIQPDGTLSAVGGATQITVNTQQFEYDENGNLSLKGFDPTALGKVLSIGEDGALTWITPVDTYSKAEIDQKIISANHLKRVVVEQIGDIDAYLSNDDFDQYIFMVPTGLETDSDKYDEYIILEIVDSEGEKARYIEQVGSWEVDLSDYAKKSDLNNYVEKIAGSRLITEEEIAQFSQGEKNTINSASSDFTIDENRQLNLNNLPVSKITNLQQALDGKYNRTDGQLITESDRKKLDALQLNGEDLEISGTVNASQIVDLEDWLNNNAKTVKGLSENNLTNELYDKIVNVMSIKSISSQLKIESGNLSIVEIESEQVKGLEQILAEKASISSVTNLANDITSISTVLNSITKDVTNNTSDIATLQQQLVWHSVID